MPREEVYPVRPAGRTAVSLIFGCMIVVSGCSPQSGAGPNARVASQERELKFVVQKLELHPILTNAAKRKTFKSFAAKELALADTPLPDWRIVEIEERLAAWFHDPHTAVYGWAPYPTSRALPVAFAWASDAFITIRQSDTPRSVQTGDRVLAISGVPVDKVLGRLEELVAGNALFVRQQAANALWAESTLRGLGLVLPGGRVRLRLQRASGSTFTADLSLEPENGNWRKAEARAYSRFVTAFELPAAGLLQSHYSAIWHWAWFVTPHYGFFLLTSCVNDASYRQAVSAFFQQVAGQRSPVVVLDLQQNGGGNSNVIIPWLEHLPTKYKMSDVNLTNSQGLPAPDLPLISPVFDGKLYVLQSGQTFSSAMWFADALTGPGLGLRVGSTIGEPTAGYGNVAEYETPVLHIPFQVSKQWMRAIKGKKVQPTVPAQIPLNLTVADIQNGTNSVARWLSTLP